MTTTTTTPGLSTEARIGKALPKFTFVHAFGFPNCNAVAYNAVRHLMDGFMANDVLPIGFRDVLAELVRVLVTPFAPNLEGEDMLSPMVQAMNVPGFPNQTLKGLTRGMMVGLQAALGPNIIPYWTRRAMSSSLGSKFRLLFWDVEQLEWITGFLMHEEPINPDDCLTIFITPASLPAWVVQHTITPYIMAAVASDDPNPADVVAAIDLAIRTKSLLS